MLSLRLRIRVYPMSLQLGQPSIVQLVSEKKQKKKEKEEERGRCVPELVQWSPSHGASALRERWCRTLGGCLAFLKALAP